MPGYIMHLATAKMILDKKNITDNEYANLFFLGNMAPDIRQGDDKVTTHFWSEEVFREFVRKPDISEFKRKYGSRLNEPFVFGYFCHLYLDAMYLERYWNKHFSFYNENMEPEKSFALVKKVKVIETGQVYERSEFFSKKYYYGDYDRMNAHFLHKYQIICPFVTGGDGKVMKGVKDALHSMEEMDSYDSSSILNSMIDRISSYKPDNESIRILNLKELEQLIADVSYELSFY